MNWVESGKKKWKKIKPKKILWKHVNTYSNYLIKFMSACTQLILNGINLRDVLFGMPYKAASFSIWKYYCYLEFIELNVCE